MIGGRFVQILAPKKYHRTFRLSTALDVKFYSSKPQDYQYWSTAIRKEYFSLPLSSVALTIKFTVLVINTNKNGRCN
jgi:hypothetical protein